jgi:hypothetical protein
VTVDSVATRRDVRELGLNKHGGALDRLLRGNLLLLVLEKREHSVRTATCS